MLNINNGLLNCEKQTMYIFLCVSISSFIMEKNVVTYTEFQVTQNPPTTY
jgi:hypothetical protein